MLLKTKTEELKVPTGLWSSPIYELTSEHGEQIKIDVTTSSPSGGIPPKKVIINEVIPFFKSEMLRSVLDLGAGALRHTIPLLKAGFQVYAVEFKELFQRRSCLGMLKNARNYKNFSTLMTPSDFIANKRKYDAALLCNVLQIMPVEKERRILLKYISEKLHNQAYLLYIGSVSGAYKRNLLHVLHRVNDGYFVRAKREYKAFYRDFTAEEIHALMAEFGFQRERKPYGSSFFDQIYLYTKHKGKDTKKFIKREIRDKEKWVLQIICG